MSIYAISDLHLSFRHPVSLDGWDAQRDRTKPMDTFGWHNHEEQIRDHWLATVRTEDTVLIPGDISWAMRLCEAVHDLDWIAQLPGRKILSPGNHCYYYRSKKQIRAAMPLCMKWLDADGTLVEGQVIVATRGWNLPGDPYFREGVDRGIYDRQVGRLRLALQMASRNHPGLPIIAMLHYPPLTTHVSSSGFFDLLQDYNVHTCVYGHLHGKTAETAIEGRVGHVHLKLVSCDVLQFRPYLVLSS